MADISNHIEAVAKALLGEPNPKLSSKTELRYGNNGSMSVDLKGTWYCHETETGGGVADLIRKHNPMANVPDFLESIGIEVDKPNGHANGHDTIKSSLVATYPYADENGEVLYEVLRFEPKTFRQRRYVDGKAVWGLGDTQPLPYRLPDILNNPNKPILIVEGEKDADTLANLGFVATCNSGGAGKFSDSLTPYFQGRDVIIIPDNDKAGDAHVRTVVSKLQGTAKRIKVVKLPVDDKGDVTDWVNTGGDRKGLTQLIKEAEELKEKVTPLPVLSLDDIQRLPPVQWLVQDLIPKGSLAMLYGEPGCGKTFIALDIALSVAHKAVWHDYDVNGGQVVYVAGEGVGGLKKRISAWHIHNEMEQHAPFIVIPTSIDLMADEDCGNLADTIRAVATDDVALVIFDTLARSMTGDENSSQDTSVVVKAMDNIRESFGCGVLAVHHSGKDSSRKARGSSAWLGAVDASIKVERLGETVSMTVEKQKDAEMIDPMWFSTTSIEVETDPLGLEPETSLVLTKTTDAPAKDRAKGLRPAQRAVLEALTEALIRHGRPSPGGENYPSGVTVVDEKHWKDVAMNKTISEGGDDAKRKAFGRAAKELLDKKYAFKWDNLVWTA